MTVSDPRAAFAATYREHLGWVLQVVGRLGVFGVEREDVTHDVFATAWRRIDTFSEGGSMRAWLFGIAFRHVRNRRNARATSEQVEADLSQRVVADGHPESVLEGETTRRNVARALEALPLDQRALFVGHDIEATPIVELARALDVPLNTAYSRLRLARQRFRSTFTALQEGVAHE